MRANIHHLIYSSDLYATRAMLGFAELVWALALFWPGETFDRPTYKIMAQVASESTWAAAFLVTGLLQWGILLSGRYHDRLVLVFACWNSALWTFSTIAMYLSVYPPPAAISGELAMAVGACWVLVRTGLPAGDRRKNVAGGSHA
jgi:hypothetical protein